MSRFWLLFIFIESFASPAWCLDPHKPITQYVHTVWHSEDGLPQQPRGERPPFSQFRILLAEDNLVNQRLAVRMLEKMGHQVVVAHTGQEALEALPGGPLIWS